MTATEQGMLTTVMQLQDSLAQLTQIEPHALNWLQFQYLKQLNQQALGVSALAQLFKVDKSNASRQLKLLAQHGWLSMLDSSRDGRARMAVITPAGRLQYLDYQSQVDKRFALIQAQFTAQQWQQQQEHITRLHKAIRQSQLQQGFELREIEPKDNQAIASIIRQVSAEYGLGADQGFAVADVTLDSLAAVYQASGSGYWVISYQGKLLGGGGIAPLAGSNPTDKICELQKMYFLPSLRGRGLARRLAQHALQFAKDAGYQQCYLETTARLTEAIALYQSLGFESLCAAKGNTGHNSCELAMLKQL